MIAFLDPTIEKLCFEQVEGKTFIHLKFKNEEEIVLNTAVDLEQYLSSGTIKGIITFSMVKEVLQSGGYLLVDEIENHFNKEIVTTLVRFFMDSRFNKNGGTLIIGFSLLNCLEFFVFRKMKSSSTINHPLCGCESNVIQKKLPFRVQ